MKILTKIDEVTCSLYKLKLIFRLFNRKRLKSFWISGDTVFSSYYGLRFGACKIKEIIEKMIENRDTEI